MYVCVRVLACVCVCVIIKKGSELYKQLYGEQKNVEQISIVFFFCCCLLNEYQATEKNFHDNDNINDAYKYT